VGLCNTKVGSVGHFSPRNRHIRSRALIHRTHLGSITYLSFPTRSHLISASDDGTICLYHTRDWALLTTLRGHKERVNSVAIHSSMKVGLSVGKDRTLRMWDLMRGKGSASTKLGKGGTTVEPTLPLYTEQFARGRSHSMDTIRNKVCSRVTNVDRYLFHGMYSSKSQHIYDLLTFT
jgi:WD40 repeat protein